LLSSKSKIISAGALGARQALESLGARVDA